VIGEFGFGSSGLEQEPVAGCFEYCNELPGYVKGKEFL
jgi:hypothetical protein